MDGEEKGLITIGLLKNHPSHIQALSQIWYEVLGKIWVPDTLVEQVVEKFKQHLNENILPLTLVALEKDQPIGMCSLRENDGIRPDLTPWLGSLVVDSAYQRKGIGHMLINATKEKAQVLGFKKLYLLTFDPTLPQYYGRLGWHFLGMDVLKNKPVTVMEIAL